MSSVDQLAPLLEILSLGQSNASALVSHVNAEPKVLLPLVNKLVADVSAFELKFDASFMGI